MNDEERARILHMVAEGKISPEEAADLLEALQPSTAPAPEPAFVSGGPGPLPSMNPIPPMGAPRLRRRTLVIQIREGGENRVNVRIPLSLTRVAGKFIPRQAQNYLGKYDINLQEFLDGVGDGDSGTLLEVKDGENKVLIAVE